VVQKSPARARPAEPEAWLPVPNVDTLPALEELLDDDRLVHSGQTQAITDTQPTPVVPPEQRWAEFRERVPKPKHLRQRRRPRRRFVAIGLALLTAAVVAFAAPRLLTHPPSVTIRVDGKERISAQTDGKTVRSVLREHKVKMSPDDRVTPGPTATVTDGLTVDVFRAFPVIVDFDGDVRSVTTTWPKPSQLVRQLDLDPTRTSIVTTPRRLAPGSSIVLRTMHEVTISVDGTQHAETTAALNVGELLQQNGVVLGLGDQISPPPDTRLTDSMTVTVSRIVSDTTQADEPLPPPTIRQDDPGLPRGQEQEIQPGKAGVQRVTYRVAKQDGQETARVPISKIPIQTPTPKVIAVGTALPSSRTTSAS
jgi:resuscitation-promoting factor RpfB